MSYGRRPHYIYSDGEYLRFGLTKVPEEEINQFLYHLLQDNRRDDLKERLLAGRETVLKNSEEHAEFYKSNEDAIFEELID